MIESRNRLFARRVIFFVANCSELSISRTWVATSRGRWLCTVYGMAICSPNNPYAGAATSSIARSGIGSSRPVMTLYTGMPSSR